MNYRVLRRMVMTTLVLCMLILCSVGYAGNIDPGNDGSQYAWGENVGWINFEPSQGEGVTVTDSSVTGKAWGENIGWINLSPNEYGGVVNDGAGILSGYAWGENVGWINFAPTGAGVKIDPVTGVFSGSAWGENIGWINFAPNGKPIKTSWRGDTTPPTGTVKINDDALYTNLTNVTLTLSCTDSGSGCAQMQFSNDSTNWSTLEAYAISKAWTLTSGDGTKTVYVKFKDNAGNWSQAFSDTILLDTTPPAIDISGCLLKVNLGASASVSINVTDNGSGVASQSAPNGINNLDTSTVGTKTFTVTATDNIGNGSSSNCTYKVIYDFLGAGGFQSPINNYPVTNTAKAGSTIPVKWQLPDGHGGFISDLGAVTSIQFQRVTCADFSSTLTDPVETSATSATGGSGLRYDTTTNQYIYNWKTEKSMAGLCYVLILQLDDGSEYRTNFSLK